MDCSELKTILQTAPLVQECDMTVTGALRIATVFRYPDGSLVDLFVDQKKASTLISDMGETTAFLLELGIAPWATRRRRSMVLDVCQTLRVRQDGGQLQIELFEPDPMKLSDAVLRLAQACIRVSDMSQTFAPRATSAFREQVEAFIESTELPYESDYELPGLMGAPVEIDFRVEGSATVSLVETLTASNEPAGRHASAEVFAKWYDIRGQRSDSQQFVTVVDSWAEVFEESDLKRIEEFSKVISYPEQQETLLQALVA